MMLDIKDLLGIIPPIVTPVDSNENVDPAGLQRVIDHVLRGGVHGVFVLGSNGEFFAFDDENQKRAVEITVKHVNGSVPVYAGAGSITTAGCIKFAKMAKEAGVDAITVLTPMFINPSEIELFNHFKTIAESTSLPIILYNNPGKTTNNISVGLLKKLADIDNIIGIKNSTLDFAHTLHFLIETRNNENFKVLAGTDFYIYATLAHGGAGAVAGTANVAPGLVVEIYNKFISGDHEGALEAQYKLVPLRDAFSYGSFPVVMKDCLNLMGMNIGSPVKPIDHCTGDKLGALKKVLSDLNLIQ